MASNLEHAVYVALGTQVKSVARRIGDRREAAAEWNDTQMRAWRAARALNDALVYVTLLDRQPGIGVRLRRACVNQLVFLTLNAIERAVAPLFPDESGETTTETTETER